MRKLLITLCVTVVSCLSVKAELKAGGEYYIWLNIYEKLLGTNEAGDGPALSAYGTKSDGYVFVAEASGESGYFLLKQKSSGKYLAASGSNNWSITLESKSTDTRFRWKMTGPDSYAFLTNKKNSSSYVGIDGASKGKDYVSVYYDKRKSSHGQFSVIPAVGSFWDEARQAYCSGNYENAQGVNEVDYCQLNNKEIDRSDAVDIHITSNDNPIFGSSSVNLGSDRTWLIFDNIIPSQVISTYLKYVTINGDAAKNGTNCRVAIYLNGAAVIPLPEVAMTCDGTEGEFTLAVGNHKDLSEVEQSNTMTSFTLRRGYMATLACGTNGSWYSRVFVADHADQVVTLPNALTKRVTSVNIKPWQYLSKKGWGNTSGSIGGPGLRATWFWSWSAGYSSTTDMEYVPCRQHVYWPNADEVNSKTATAAISINEPDHPEQHTQHETKPCTCPVDKDSKKIIEWTTYGLSEDFQAGGGRIGSPQPQNNADFSYLTQFFKYVDENNNHSRCDIAVSHSYLPIGSRNADNYAKYVTDTYWNLWNSVKRPIWLTELEVGATWNDASSVITSDDKAREYLQALLQRLEESDYIERYAIYGFDWWRNNMYWDQNVSKGLTPAGQVYRDHRSTFAYNSNYTKVPAWWAPSAQKPTLTYTVNMEEQTVTFTVGNGNADATDQLLIEYSADGSSWQTLLTLSDDRNLLESNTVTMTASFDDLDISGGQFRATSTTLYGGSATSDVVAAPVFADLEELPALIAEAEAHQLGFESGKYAPYNNTTILNALAVVKAMKVADPNFQTSCDILKQTSWQQNSEELNAIYDGQFANTAANATSGDINLPGWTKVNGIRLLVKDVSKDPGLAYTDGKAAVFSWGATTLTYGEQTGYTMPLAKHQFYELTLKVSGWRDGDLPTVFSIDFDGVKQEVTPNVKRINNATENPFQTLTFQITPTADNSILKIYANKHFAIADLSLKRAVEKGDVDGSGVIDINDVKALVNSILGDKPVGFFDRAADLNGDGNVDITDVTKLIEKVLSLQ